MEALCNLGTPEAAAQQGELRLHRILACAESASYLNPESNAAETFAASSDGNSYSGLFSLTSYDTSGNVTVSFTGVIAATRMDVKPPVSPSVENPPGISHVVAKRGKWRHRIVFSILGHNASDLS